MKVEKSPRSHTDLLLCIGIAGVDVAEYVCISFCDGEGDRGRLAIRN